MKAIEKMNEMIRSQETEMLCEVYEGLKTKQSDGALATRELIINELEARSPEKFENWMLSDEDVPSIFYTN